MLLDMTRSERDAVAADHPQSSSRTEKARQDRDGGGARRCERGGARCHGEEEEARRGTWREGVGGGLDRLRAGHSHGVMEMAAQGRSTTWLVVAVAYPRPGGRCHDTAKSGVEQGWCHCGCGWRR